MAAEALIEIHRSEPHMSNWTAPVLHLIRQTLELKLKALNETIRWRINEQDKGAKLTHNLKDLWAIGRSWLVEKNYEIEQDARLPNADRLIENLHAIDPTGDLFRFGTSREEAFGRQKSSDRVGFNQTELFPEFADAVGCLSHWTGVLMREIIQAEQGWDEYPIFDREDFPRRLSD